MYDPLVFFVQEKVVQDDKKLILEGYEAWIKENVLEPMDRLAQELHSVRAETGKVPRTAWDSHTHRTNVAREVSKQIRKHTNAQLVNNAWVKFFEMLSLWEVLPKRLSHHDSSSQSGLVSLHLCEAPGGFVAALHHYLHQEAEEDEKAIETKWKWFASSLNPMHEPHQFKERWHLNDSYGLLRETMEHWLFGPDGSGDLLQPSTVHDLSTRLGGKVDLVTADGSVAFSDNEWINQEQEVLALKLAEVIRLVKPFASKAGSTEVYLLALGFRGVSDALKDHLFNLVGNRSCEKDILTSSYLAMHNVPPSTLLQLVQAARYFAESNVTAIQNNLKLFHAYLDSQQSVDEIERYWYRKRVDWAQKFFQVIGVYDLPRHICLLPADKL